MVKILKGNEATARHWIGRDDNAAHHHGLIAEPIVTLTLGWKKDESAAEELVARLWLDMEWLVEWGFAKRESAGYRLRFQRTGNRIELANNRRDRALPLPVTLEGYSG